MLEIHNADEQPGHRHTCQFQSHQHGDGLWPLVSTRVPQRPAEQCAPVGSVCHSHGWPFLHTALYPCAGRPRRFRRQAGCQRGSTPGVRANPCGTRLGHGLPPGSPRGVLRRHPREPADGARRRRRRRGWWGTRQCYHCSHGYSRIRGGPEPASQSRSASCTRTWPADRLWGRCCISRRYRDGGCRWRRDRAAQHCSRGGR